MVQANVARGCCNDAAAGCVNGAGGGGVAADAIAVAADAAKAGAVAAAANVATRWLDALSVAHIDTMQQECWQCHSMLSAHRCQRAVEQRFHIPGGCLQQFGR